jgi:hypothetical protein
MENFIQTMFIHSINLMKTKTWKWPEYWTMQQKQDFLTQSLTYAEHNELFEQCNIIKKIQTKISKT